MDLAERIAHHERMALSYRNAYLDKTVHEGEQYERWTFAADAIYFSPYFTSSELKLSEVGSKNGEGATLEAQVYALTFPDWKPQDFKYWTADHGFVMKTRWQGTMENDTTMGFYSYSFVDTNEKGEVARWETHVNDEYNPFLEVAVGVTGPFHGHAEYLDALRLRLAKEGK